MRSIKDKSKDQLIKDKEKLLHRISELEKLEAKCKQTEETLRKTEKRFKDIAENTLEWIWEVDINGKYTYASPVVEKILGYKPSELLKKHFYDLFYPEDREELKKKAFKVFAKKQPFREFVNRNIHKNGKPVWLLTSGVPILNEKGNLVGYRGADIDITERKKAEEALRESKDRYRIFTEEAMVGVYIYSEKRYLFVNKAMQDITGYSRDELLKINPHEIVIAEDRSIIEKRQEARKRGKKVPIEYTVRIRRKNGELAFVMTRVHPKPILYENKEAYLGHCMDITESKRAEQALQESEEKYRNLVERANDGILIIQDGIVKYVNPRLAEMAGCSVDELIGKKFIDYVHPAEISKLLDRYQRRMEGKNVEPIYETVLKRKDGSDAFAEINAGSISYQGKIADLVFIRDITKRKQQEETIKQLAYHDALTGLPNRTLFNDRLNDALKHAHRYNRKLAVMLLDLDRFKDINDSLGHTVGDRLLKRVGNRLRKHLRKSDTIARMGGDEFLVLVKEIKCDKDAGKVAQKILKAIRYTFTVDNHKLPVTTSIGIAIYPSDGKNINTLMKNVDIAMYHAKDEGRNNCQRYAPSLSIKRRKRL